MTGRILIADDVATNRIILKVKLASASYDVIQACTRDELVDKARQQRLDLIILDGGFHNGQGIELCQKLGQDPKTAAIPVIIITDQFSPDDRLAALQAGAFEVLAKPVEDNGLLARVRNVLRVRAVEEELHLREGTALELGFQESATPFCAPAHVLVIDPDSVAAPQWQRPLKSATPCLIHHADHASALEQVVRQKLTPDIVILPARLDMDTDSHFLLAELRNRPETRHSAIVVVNTDPGDRNAITALDIGANDVVNSDTPAAEFIFRLTRHLERKQKSDQLRNTFKDGLRMAMIDPLTGLFNRRYALPHMARIAEKSQTSGSPFAVMVLDLDHFKKINDSYGHGAGDMVLSEIANRLKANIRSVDLLARIGGEEFLVVLPDTDMQAARITAERLRRVTQETPVCLSEFAGEISVTTSIGVSIGGQDNAQDTTVENMVDRADQALMGAKSTGRNQVIFEKNAA